MRKMNLASGVVCIIIGLMITILAIILDPEIQNETYIDYVRLVLPGFLFVVFLIWLKKKNSLNKWAFVLLAFSLPVYVLVVNWFAIFTLTNYREHHAAIIYSLILLYLVFFFSMLTFERRVAKHAQNKAN